MKIKSWTPIIPVALLAAFFFIFSCATRKQVATQPAGTAAGGQPEVSAGAEAGPSPGAGQPGAIQEQGLAEESTAAAAPPAGAAAISEDAFVNQDVHFEFDSIRLNAEARRILRQTALRLQAHPRVTVTIEGHCDSRGTNEYNLALGDRRAQSVKQFLIDLGIDPSRLHTVSYGEERPLDPAENERAWAKNRRAHFVIQN